MDMKVAEENLLGARDEHRVGRRGHFRSARSDDARRSRLGRHDARGFEFTEAAAADEAEPDSEDQNENDDDECDDANQGRTLPRPGE